VPYETGWNSFLATARSMGWRLKVADDITYERLMEWQLTLKEVGKQDWTCRTYLMALKGFSRWLNANGHLITDPGARFRTPRLKRTIPILPALHFIADQGLMGFVGKGQRQRSVALPRQALEIVRHYLASRNGDGHRPEAPLIWKEDGSGEALSYYVINRVVTRWTRRHLGVRLTPHKLRHAYGKHCVDRGVDIRVIAEALGHESLESTKIYTQVSFERTRRIAELFSLPGV
jgi:site-specific recombinase XerC